MEFELVHTVRIPREEYFEVVLSDAFVEWVKHKLQQDERKVVRCEEIDGVLYRTVQSERVMSHKAQKHFKVPRFVMLEHQAIRRDEGSYSWEYVPNIGQNRFSAKGTGRLEAVAEGVRLNIRGELSIRIPLIGKRIEKHTLGWVRENFHKALEALEEYYRTEHPKKAG